jgi:predicted nuclease of predicted toxin-antitoxin system
MIFWIDAQLPPTLAAWLEEIFAVKALALRELGLRDATDDEIFAAARAASGVVLTSKDSDFVERVSRLGPPPQLLWVTCGNVSNDRLRAVLVSAFPSALEMLEAGEPIVELADLAQ